MTVYFATNSSMYQDRVLNRIVFKYLYDNEYSVRHAASKCLLRYDLNHIVYSSLFCIKYYYFYFCSIINYMFFSCSY